MAKGGGWPGRYYFDTITNAGKRQHFDAEGQELPGLEAVRDEAMGILCEITRDALRGRSRLDLGVSVRNGRGTVVLRADLSLVADFVVSELAADCAVYVLNEPGTMIEEADQKDFAPISRSEAGRREFIPSGRFNPRM